MSIPRGIWDVIATIVQVCSEKVRLFLMLAGKQIGIDCQGCFCLSVSKTKTEYFSVLSLAGKPSSQPSRSHWCRLIIPFCCFQWSRLCPGSRHGRGHRGLALGIQGELFPSTHGAKPFTVKSASSLGSGLLMFVVLEEVSNGRTFCCLTGHEVGV